LRQLADGRVRYELTNTRAAPLPPFCKTDDDDLLVTPGKSPIQQVTHPLPPSVVAGHNVSCSWARLDYRAIPNSNLSICTYSPTVDTVISSALHREGKWVGVLEWEALRAAGMCTRRRPFVIDVGAGFGSFSLMAASSGCQVIAFEPHPPNMARMMESFAVNGFLNNATFMLNAIHRSEGTVALYVEPHNPGAARVVRTSTARASTAPAITLSSFFRWAGRPRNPHTGFRVSPSDIAAIRVDTESHGLAVLDSMRDLLAGGQPPLVSLHYYPGLSRNGVGCDARQFLDFAYAAGYKMYLAKELWSRKRWDEYLDKETWSCQPMLVHRSVAAGAGAAVGLPLAGFTPYSKFD
jgi:FkbM family methyltransferase